MTHRNIILAIASATAVLVSCIIQWHVIPVALYALTMFLAGVFAGDPAPTATAPTTTEQQNLTKAGQRKINLIWEYTQAFIAVLVVLSNLVVGVWVGLGWSATKEVPPMLTNALFLVVGFYFSRTNHSAIGGVGNKPQEEYMGR